MAASVKAATPVLDDLIVEAQQADVFPWEALGVSSTVRQRIFTRGLPLGQQPQPQPVKRVEQGGPGDYISG